MKASKYNLYFKKGNECYVFNQITSSLLNIDDNLFIELNNGRVEINNLDADEIFNLKSAGVITEILNEENYILYSNRMARYNSKTARFTIIPTLECNFNCWYCYENHVLGKMNNDTLEAIYNAICKIIKHSQVNTIVIDWFGGEPLICFNDIIYPFSKKIKLLCAETGNNFINQITTNGYLIDEDIISKFIEIDLKNFQITLDGDENNHNKSRFSNSDKSTYTKIVSNIEKICEQIDAVNMTVRINYLPDSSFIEIVKSFKTSVRNKIQIQPQIIWQYKNNINENDKFIQEQLELFANEGYSIKNAFMPNFLSVSCYTDNMLQFAINWDGQLFKCTARDFSTSKTSIGKIESNGNMIFNSYYYDHFQSSAFENKKCLKCNILPSCMGGCLQKKIENQQFSCPKESLHHSILNQLNLIVENSE